MTERPFRGGVVSMCFGRVLAECEKSGFPIYERDCYIEGYCVDSHTVEGAAYCAYLEDTCEHEGERICREDSYKEGYLTCKNGVWFDFSSCSDYEECVDGGDAGAYCM
jgi:hypothetical protein